MTTQVKPIPDGFHSVTPYLTLRNASQAIEFYKRAFGAQERFSMPGPDGKVAHAEIMIGNSILMLGEECPQMGNQSPEALQGSPVGMAPARCHRCVLLKDEATLDRDVKP